LNHEELKKGKLQRNHGGNNEFIQTAVSKMSCHLKETDVDGWITLNLMLEITVSGKSQTVDICGECSI